MNWVTVVWSLAAGACITLGVTCLLIWRRVPARHANRAFAVAALATAGIAFCELSLISTTEVRTYENVQRWAHVPVAVLLVALAFFTRFYFQTTRPWLFWLAVTTRLLVLLVNFRGPGSVNLSKVVSLEKITLLGQPVTLVGEAVTNPWNRLAGANSLLFLVLFIDTSIRLWRRGDADSRRRALWIGGALVTFMLLAAGHAYLVNQQVIDSPFIITLCFMGIILAMARQLGHDVIEAEERAGRLIEASPYSMIMVNDLARIVMVNLQTETAFGYPREELLGQPLEILIPERFRQSHAAMHAGFVRSPVSRRMGEGRELWGLRRDGTEFPIEVGLTPVETSEGRFVLASVSDITDRKRMEAEAHEQRDELAHLSRVTSLGLLSGSLAHEINQPLGIILANAQAGQLMLDQGNPDLEEMREILDDIVSEDLRAGEAIKRLRALLKRGQSKLVPVNVNELVMDVLKLMQSDLTRRNVTVTTELAREMASVSADPVQIQQVLLNLILNACEAMEDNPEERRLITVSTCAQPDGARISIQDQGCGLPVQDSQRLFQPFFTTKEHGMGIGLAISKSIVAAHHGNLRAESNPGGGATFHLELHPDNPAPA